MENNFPLTPNSQLSHHVITTPPPSLIEPLANIAHQKKTLTHLAVQISLEEESHFSHHNHQQPRVRGGKYEQYV